MLASGVLSASHPPPLLALGVVALVFGTGQLVLLKRLPEGHPLRQIGFTRHFSDRATLWYCYADIAAGVIILGVALARG
jgi:hypothetical protein